MKYTNLFFLFFLAAAAYSSLQAQEQSFAIDKEMPYEVYISGSSTLHDWKATVGKVIDFPATLTFKPGNGGKIETFGFKAEGKSMDGGRGTTMNDKIYKAVKCDVHPYITFQQSQAAEVQAMPDGQFKLNSTGKLAIGGVEKEISVEVIGTMKAGKLTFTGEKPLKLSDFSIDPPSAMFGQIQTRDDISVHFTFNYLAE